MTCVRLHTLPLLFGLFVVGVAPAPAQTPLTLEDAIRRAQGETADARALASTIEEANARIERAQSGFWPRVDVTETVQRGDQPVFVFSSLLSQRRFSAANFAIPSLNDPDPVTNTRTSVALEQRIFDSGLTHLGVQTAKLEREAASASGDAARQDLAFRAAQAFVQVLQFEATARAADAAVLRRRAIASVLAHAGTSASLPRRMCLPSRCTWRTCASGRSGLGRPRGVTSTARRSRRSAADGLVVPVRPASRPVPADADALVRDALTTHPDPRQADVHLQLADNGRRTARARSCPASACRQVGNSTVKRCVRSNQAGDWRRDAHQRVQRVC